MLQIKRIAVIMIPVALLILNSTVLVNAEAKVNTVRGWADLIDAVKADERLSAAKDAFLVGARKRAELEVIRRVYKLEDIGKKHRSWYSGIADTLGPETKETFALSMSDYMACSNVEIELPMLAAAYRLTGEEIYKKRVLAQLEEMTNWSPLQRPGWSCYEPGRYLPEDGKDGNWLATGLGVRAIANTLEIMPEGSIPHDLRQRLHSLLEEEIYSIVEDWNVKRQWFVKYHNPMTNQWVLPTEGLVRACLVVGKEKHKDAYELGVKNLLTALDSHGKDGEFEEGINYAQVTMTSLLYTAKAMAEAGDDRAIDHPFLKRFPMWAVHHIQPGGFTINSFDSIAFWKGNTSLLRPMLSISAICTGSEISLWGLDQVGGCSWTLPVLLGAALPPADLYSAPQLYAYYERTTRVNWRDSWFNFSSGVWVRGGHETDGHDHHDRGHVNYIYHGKPILIESGTPAYSFPTVKRCQSCEGHNVLQIGHANSEKKPAPITVRKLDETGGDIEVDGSLCYPEVQLWDRDVEWSSSNLTVFDTVRLNEDKQEVIRFRWHLGTKKAVQITGKNRRWIIKWPDAKIVLESSTPVIVRQEEFPDYTLEQRDWLDESPEYVHACVIVESADKTDAMRLVTRVEPQ